MAKTIEDIKKNITDIYVLEMATIGYLVDPSKWSYTNVQRLFIYVFAVCQWVLEKLFDLLRADVDTAIRELKPHTERWYANKAKMYQHGFNLNNDSDIYNNTDYTTEQVEASKVVKYSAVVEEMSNTGRMSLRIKVAGHDGTDLNALSKLQLDGVKEYFKRIKDAGVLVRVESLPPDDLIMSWVIYYDPLILNGNGSRLDGQESEPVQTAIKSYLQNLPFNGTFVLQYHTDAVQNVDGVVICNIENAQARYGGLAYSNINTKYTPDAGYLRFKNDADLIIKFIPQSEIR